METIQQPIEYKQRYTKGGLELYELLLSTNEISEGSELAILTLWGSCISRENAVRYGLTVDKNRKFLFKNAEDLFFTIIRKKPEMFEKWLLLTEEYIESGFDSNYRPNIDRIDNDGDYEFDNIQALSSIGNRMKEWSVIPKTSEWYDLTY